MRSVPPIDQYVRTKCAPVSSAAAALERAPALVGTLLTEALQGTSPLVREKLVAPRPAARVFEKVFLSDYPRGLANCFLALAVSGS